MHGMRPKFSLSLAYTAGYGHKVHLFELFDMNIHMLNTNLYLIADCLVCNYLLKLLDNLAK